MEKSKRYQVGMDIIKEYEDKSNNSTYSITFDELMDLDLELFEMFKNFILLSFWYK